ncbi:GTP pyrophosphokinase, partial [Criibacterium bergeronii]
MGQQEDIVTFLKNRDVWELDELEEFKILMLYYKSVIREVRTKLEVLNDELSMRNQRNPIEFVKSRLKKPSSIAQKLRRRGLPLTTESIKENIQDVAGIRVVCSFSDDIYKIADMLIKQDDIKLLQIKDYIKEPKPNGYSSLHI